MICQYYNQGPCANSATRDTKGITYCQICAFCFAKNGKKFSAQRMNAETKLRQKIKTYTHLVHYL